MIDAVVDALRETELTTGRKFRTVLLYIGTYDAVTKELFTEPPEGLFIYRGVLFACLVGGPAYGWEVIE